MAQSILDRVLHWELLLTLQPVTERFSLDVGHHIVEQPVDFAGVVERQDVWMGELRGDLDFLQERPGAEGLGQSGLRTLRATLRQCFKSSARKTIAIPPRPSSRSMR